MLRLLTLVVAAVVSCASAQAETYPAKPVTIVVPFAPGGTTDAVARIFAQAWSQSLGTTVVENRSGGAGVLGWGSVARAAPDGYTVLCTEMSYAISAGMGNLPFDPRASFSQVSIAVSVPHVLVVPNSVPAKTVAEFVALAKANPGKMFFGSGGPGTNTHMGGELFKSLAGVDLVHVPYRGAGAVLPDLLGGTVQMLVNAVPTTLPLIRSSQLRPLMVTSEQRLSVLPDVPSAAEAGLPDMVMKFWVGFAVPAGTPPAVVERLNAAVRAALAAPDTKARLADLGLDPVGNTPAEAAQYIDADIKRWGTVAKNAGITTN
jgi:tripartite-type tricarboxylate transporter receptor subunit TctC